MSKIIKIRLHGRGGLGAKTAAQFIVEAAIMRGKYIQAYPEFGPERSGAPTRAFVKIADFPIKSHEPITSPDIILAIDHNLILDPQNLAAVLIGDCKEAVYIFNSHEEPGDLKKRLKIKGKVYTVDATAIAIEEMKENRPNTPILGALIKITNVVPLSSLLEVVEKRFGKKLGKEGAQRNINAIKRAYRETKI